MKKALAVVLLLLGSACEPEDPTTTYPVALVTFAGSAPTCEAGGALTYSPPWFDCRWYPGAWYEGELCTPLELHYIYETTYWRLRTITCSGVSRAAY